MAESIFGATWWPIHVAVAWVLTRDRAFVERSNRAGKSLRSIAAALAMDKVEGKPTDRYFKDTTDAWSALREEMAAGNVRASGTPFLRVADLEGGAVNASDIAREIPAVEIASLRLQDDGNDKDCLVPEDWRVAHGSNPSNLRGYRNVQIFRDDVLYKYAEGATPYVPDWERLSEAVKRVVATGVNEDQAKQAICTAIADRKIKIRFSIASEEGGASFGEHVVGTVRHGDEIEIPSQLAPDDFNWQESRPLKPWRDIREGSAPALRWHPEWIEVFRADVTRVLIEGRNEEAETVSPAAPSSIHTRRRQSRGRAMPQREGAMEALVAVFGKDIPDHSAVPNKVLYKKINEYRKEKRLPELKPDSILRAAGRRN